MSKARISKVLAGAGVASRRAIEEMVLEGRITVNGEFVAKLPCFVDLQEDEIRVDGRPVRRKAAQLQYFLINKPRGVVCTQRDPAGRPRAVDLLPKTPERLFPVGRLDVETTGLLILTNDGDLTEYLTHPSHGVEKTYVAEVEGRMTPGSIEALKKGVYLDGRRTQRARVKVLRRSAERSLVEITICEGRNREVRRLLARLGHKVRRLKRTGLGPLTDRGLKIGSCRVIRPKEVKQLRECGRASSPPERRQGEPRGPKKPE
jgi:23S rRNA pseudouridine2605 synthase